MKTEKQTSTLQDIGDTITKVTKFTGTTILVLAGIVITVKLSKVLLKDIEGMGI